jgi:hypothetical protein
MEIIRGRVPKNPPLRSPGNTKYGDLWEALRTAEDPQESLAKVGLTSNARKMC